MLETSPRRASTNFLSKEQYNDIYKALTGHEFGRHHKTYDRVREISTAIYVRDKKEVLRRTKALDGQTVRYIKNQYEPKISPLLRAILYKIEKIKDEGGDCSIVSLEVETDIDRPDLYYILQLLMKYGMVVYSFETLHSYYNTNSMHSGKFRLTDMGLVYVERMVADGFTDIDMIEKKEEFMKEDSGYFFAEKQKAINYLKSMISKREGIFIHDVVLRDDIHKLPLLRNFTTNSLSKLLKGMGCRRVLAYDKTTDSDRSLYVVRDQDRYKKYPANVIARLWRYLRQVDEDIDEAIKPKRKDGGMPSINKSKVVEMLTLYHLGYLSKQIEYMVGVSHSTLNKYVKILIPLDMRRKVFNA